MQPLAWSRPRIVRSARTEDRGGTAHRPCSRRVRISDSHRRFLHTRSRERHTPSRRLRGREIQRCTAHPRCTHHTRQMHRPAHRGTAHSRHRGHTCRSNMQFRRHTRRSRCTGHRPRLRRSNPRRNPPRSCTEGIVRRCRAALPSTGLHRCNPSPMHPAHRFPMCTLPRAGSGRSPCNSCMRPEHSLGPRGTAPDCRTHRRRRNCTRRHLDTGC